MDRTMQSIVGVATLVGAGVALWTLLSGPLPGAGSLRSGEAATSFRRASLPTTRAGLESYVKEHGSNVRAWIALGEVRARDGEADAAREANERAAELIEASIFGDHATNATNSLAWYTLGLVRAKLDQAEPAREAFETAAVLLDAITRRDPGPRNYYNLACYRALAGHHDSALDAFERAIKTGWNDRRWAMADADLVSIRDDPRFAAALDTLGTGRMMIIEGP